MCINYKRWVNTNHLWDFILGSGELMETPMCFLLGELTNVSKKKFVDGPIKVAPSNKHKEEKKRMQCSYN
jgi:hypothetical protein